MKSPPTPISYLPNKNLPFPQNYKNRVVFLSFLHGSISHTFICTLPFLLNNMIQRSFLSYLTSSENDPFLRKVQSHLCQWLGWKPYSLS